MHTALGVNCSVRRCDAEQPDRRDNRKKKGSERQPRLPCPDNFALSTKERRATEEPSTGAFSLKLFRASLQLNYASKDVNFVKQEKGV